MVNSDMNIVLKDIKLIFNLSEGIIFVMLLEFVECSAFLLSTFANFLG